MEVTSDGAAHLWCLREGRAPGAFPSLLPPLGTTVLGITGDKLTPGSECSSTLSISRGTGGHLEIKIKQCLGAALKHLLTGLVAELLSSLP